MSSEIDPAGDLDEIVDRMSGRMDSVEFGEPDASISSVNFHVPNMPRMYGEWLSDSGKSWRGRSTLDAGDWLVTIDSRSDHGDVVKDLRRVGGYAATHTGKFVRKDGKPFSIQEAIDQIWMLRIFLGFSFGRNIAPVLPVGLDANEAPVWCDWGVNAIDAWTGSQQVADPSGAADFSDLFEKFADAWRDPYRKEVLYRATQYFVKANDGKPVEVAMSISQAGLELMAWSNSFTSGNASSRITELLGLCAYASDVPPTLSHLHGCALSENPSATGPQMITRMRNKIIHPARGARSYSFDEWIDAWTLAQEYLALAILQYVGYRGSYRSFLSAEKSVGAVTPVPWA
jgi:hypothetical protein